MSDQTRPWIVWCALAYIAIAVFPNILSIGTLVAQLQTLDLDTALFLISNLGLILLLIFTFRAIVGKSRFGQRLAILSFLLVGVFGFYGAIVLFQLPENDAGSGRFLAAKIIVIGRVLVSFVLGIAFGISKSVDAYFAEGIPPEPPPPTSLFD